MQCDSICARPDQFRIGHVIAGSGRAEATDCQFTCGRKWTSASANAVATMRPNQICTARSDHNRRRHIPAFITRGRNLLSGLKSAALEGFLHAAAARGKPTRKKKLKLSSSCSSRLFSVNAGDKTKVVCKLAIKGAPGSSVGKGAAVLSWGWGFESRFILWI